MKAGSVTLTINSARHHDVLATPEWSSNAMVLQDGVNMLSTVGSLSDAFSRMSVMALVLGIHSNDRHHDDRNTTSSESVTELRGRYQHQRRYSTACEHGDTNDDCKFDVNDARFTLVFIVQNNEGLQSSATGQQISAAKTYTYKALDTDHNTEINSRDVFFLNQINLGILSFAEALTVSQHGTGEGCDFGISVSMYARNDALVVTASTRISLILRALPSAEQ